MTQNETLCQVAFCPHCGNTAPQRLLKNHIVRYSVTRGEIYSFVECTSCQQPLIYHYPGPRLTEKICQQGAFYYGPSDHNRLYPVGDNLHESVPRKIIALYRDAKTIQCRAPTAFVGQMRRCLEMICNDRGTKKNNLRDKLEELHAKGEIPIALAQMTDLIRTLGNMASHDDDVRISGEYADAVDEFIRAVIDSVYVHPHKINDIKAKIAHAKKA